MMTSLQTWGLLSLSVVLLLSITPTQTEVVESMSDCGGFLLGENPPQIPGVLINGNIQDQNRYKVICQTFKNQRRFVTLYDKSNKIPVFSAYRYKGNKEGTKRPDPPWKIEPQLENRDPMSNMWDDVYTNQASNKDYINSFGYNRGHLFPCCHAFDQHDKISTFTLTNVVPQAISFNGGSWANMEKCVKCVLQKFCINNIDRVEGFVVTGAKPGTKNLNNRVNIPSVLWSAFCCYSENKNKWLAGSHWGDNAAENIRHEYLETKTLNELHEELNIEAFPNSQCPATESVSEFYPELKKECSCPPKAPTTTAPPTTSSTTAEPTLSPNISTTIDPTADTRTTTFTTTTTTSTIEKHEDNEPEENPKQPRPTFVHTAGGVIGQLGGAVLGGIVGFMTGGPLVGIVGAVTGGATVFIAGKGPNVLNQTSTASPFASTLGQTIKPTSDPSATVRPTFITTTPTPAGTPTANFTVTSTASNVTAPPQSNVTTNQTNTKSQTRPPRCRVVRRKSFRRIQKPLIQENRDNDEGSTSTWEEIGSSSGGYWHKILQ